MAEQIYRVSGEVKKKEWFRGKSPYCSVMIEGITASTFDPEVVDGLEVGMLVEKMEYVEVEKEKIIKGKKGKPDTTKMITYRNIVPPIILEGGVKIEKPEEVSQSVPQHPDFHPAEIHSLVEQGARLMQVENETQRMIAIQRPRDEAKVFDEAMAELERFPKFAKKAFYSIPYANDKGGTTMVEGPSIKAANTLARRWGNNANGWRVLEELVDRIIVEGVFLDYETNVRTLRPVSVSRFIKRKSGKIERLKTDRLNIAIQAGGSKAVRNAILNGLPEPLVDTYKDRAKAIASDSTPKGEKKKLASQQIESIVRLFVSKKKIPQGLVDAYIERHSVEYQTDASLLSHLTGLWNAIEDGEVDAKTVFMDDEEGQENLPLSNKEAKQGEK